MRLINTMHKSNGNTAKTYYDADLEEYTVKFYDGKQHRKDSDYFTDDKQDALETAELQLMVEDETVE